MSEVDDLDAAGGSLDGLADNLASPAQRDALVLGVPHPVERPPVVTKEALHGGRRHGLGKDITTVDGLVLFVFTSVVVSK